MCEPPCAEKRVEKVDGLLYDAGVNASFWDQSVILENCPQYPSPKPTYASAFRFHPDLIFMGSTEKSNHSNLILNHVNHVLCNPSSSHHFDRRIRLNYGYCKPLSMWSLRSIRLPGGFGMRGTNETSGSIIGSSAYGILRISTHARISPNPSPPPRCSHLLKWQG